MSREMEDIYQALLAGQDASASLRERAIHWSVREFADRQSDSVRSGIAAYNRLQSNLRNGRQHIEEPDDAPPRTSCYCSEPTCSPPCGWCTEPHDNSDD